MNSIDYAKVLKHLLKTRNCKYFALCPLRDKDYGIAWAINIARRAIDANSSTAARCSPERLVDGNHNDIFIYGYGRIYYEIPTKANKFKWQIAWPDDRMLIIEIGIDEQQFCKDICDVLFNASKESDGVTIGKLSPISFIDKNTTIEQVAIDAELADENI